MNRRIKVNGPEVRRYKDRLVSLLQKRNRWFLNRPLSQTVHFESRPSTLDLAQCLARLPQTLVWA